MRVLVVLLCHGITTQGSSVWLGSCCINFGLLLVGHAR